jgi:hypothetical protein
MAFMSAQLVALAQRLVDLDNEASGVRAAMLKLLSNGHDAAAAEAKPGPTQPGHKPGVPPQTNKQRLETAARAETQIIELLKAQPMGPAELARMTGARRGTVDDRLRRLKAKGLVTRGEDGWAAIV